MFGILAVSAVATAAAATAQITAEQQRAAGLAAYWKLHVARAYQVDPGFTPSWGVPGRP